MICNHCGKEIERIEIHEVFIKTVDSIDSPEDFYQNLNYGIGTKPYCPECGKQLEKKYVLENCNPAYWDEIDWDEID